MSQEKIDSGTVILDQKGAEIGVVKKVYPSGLARLELANSDSIALDVSFIQEVEITGRILKKKSAKVKDEITIFFKGASDILEKIMVENVKLLALQLSSKENKKALQYYEFDVITKIELEQDLTNYELLGLARGIELANKIAQDFIVKNVFQAIEKNQSIGEILAPEVMIDKLNQEKAFHRILWNLMRYSFAQGQQLKEIKIIEALIEIITEIGIKAIDIEYKIGVPDSDILYWNERLENYINRYIAALLLNVDPEHQQSLIKTIKTRILENVRKIKVSSAIRDEAMKSLQNFNLEKYQDTKTMELLHAGLKGFNLRVMSEIKAMKELKNKLFELLDQEKGKSTIKIQNEINKFTREVRDVSKDFQNLLFEIAQYLKKIEYGDSKVNEYYSEMMEKIQRKKLIELNEILIRLRNTFSK